MGKKRLIDSNEPLSLEELKKINGEYPVYIVCESDYGDDYCIAQMLSFDNHRFRIFRFGTEDTDIYSSYEYGKTWFAYLRKPEMEN